MRHWTRAGLLLPSRPGLVRGGWLVLGLGGVTVAVWAVRRLTGLEVMQRYAPLYGGVLILVVLLTAALVQMHARRTGRRPLRQWPVWLGLALGLLPPAVETVQQVLAWEAAAAP